MTNKRYIAIILIAFLAALILLIFSGANNEISAFNGDIVENTGSLPAMRPAVWNGIEISNSTIGRAIIVIGDNPSDKELEDAEKLRLLFIDKVRYDVVPVKKQSELTDNEKIDYNLIFINSVNVSSTTNITISFEEAKKMAIEAPLINKFKNYSVSSVEILKIIDGNPPLIETRFYLSNDKEKIEVHIIISASTGRIIEGEGYQKSWTRYLNWDKNPELVNIVENARENVKEQISQYFGDEKLYAIIIEQNNSWTVEFYRYSGGSPIVSILQK